MPEVTQLGRGRGEIQTQEVPESVLGVGEAYSAHNRLSWKLVDVEEEEEERQGRGERKVIRKVKGTDQSQ